MPTSEQPSTTEYPAGLMTLAEVTTLLHVSAWTLSRLVNSGEMPTVRIGRRRLITRADYETFIGRRREEYSRRGW